MKHLVPPIGLGECICLLASEEYKRTSRAFVLFKDLMYEDDIDDLGNY